MDSAELAALTLSAFIVGNATMLFLVRFVAGLTGAKDRPQTSRSASFHRDYEVAPTVYVDAGKPPALSALSDTSMDAGAAIHDWRQYIRRDDLIGFHIPVRDSFGGINNTRVKLTANEVAQFFMLEQPRRARRNANGQWQDGWRGTSERYGLLVEVARTYGWIESRPRGPGYQWAKGWESIGRRVTRIEHIRGIRLALPSPAEV